MIVVDCIKNQDQFLSNIKFKNSENNIVSLIGYSGCGKTTMLNLLSGVITPDSGKIIINNKYFYSSNKNINLSIHKRNVGYIQQKNTIFPHLTVYQNIIYGIKEKKQQKQVNEIIDFFEIEDILDKFSNQISGGQAKRVVIARAVLSNPQILLMDEPFEALDYNKRLKFRRLIKKMNKEFLIPVIFVTHDIDEAYEMGDKIAIINQGKIIQFDYKEEVYDKPKGIIAAKITGVQNIFSGKIIADENGTFKFINKELELQLSNTFSNFFGEITIGIRSENIVLVKEKKNGINVYHGKIKKVIEGYRNCYLLVTILESQVLVKMTISNKYMRMYELCKKEYIFIKIPPEKLIYIERKKKK